MQYVSYICLSTRISQQFSEIVLLLTQLFVIAYENSYKKHTWIIQISRVRLQEISVGKLYLDNDQLQPVS